MHTYIHVCILLSTCRRQIPKHKSSLGPNPPQLVLRRLMSAELEHFLHVRLKDGSVRIMQQSEFLLHMIEEGASIKESEEQWKIYMAADEWKKTVRCFSGGSHTWGAPLPHSLAQAQAGRPSQPRPTVATSSTLFGSVDNNVPKKHKVDAEAQKAIMKLNHSSSNSSSSSS
jgi:hypothetical protein